MLLLWVLADQHSGFCCKEFWVEYGDLRKTVLGVQGAAVVSTTLHTI